MTLRSDHVIYGVVDDGEPVSAFATEEDAGMYASEVDGEVFEFVTRDFVEELAQTHKEKFTEYWGLKEEEEKLLDDFVDQFCRIASGEVQKEAMKQVIDDMLEGGDCSDQG